MKSVKIAELKDHLSQHLRAVEGGDEIVVTDRRRPIARIVPVSTTPRVQLIPPKRDFMDVRDQARRRVDLVTPPRTCCSRSAGRREGLHRQLGPPKSGPWRARHARALSDITAPTSSELIRIECLRTVDRARVQQRLDESSVSRVRADLLRSIESLTLITLGDAVKARAAEPFPTHIGTLDALHLSSALLVRDELGDLLFATHDDALGIAAMAMGFEVLS